FRPQRLQSGLRYGFYPSIALRLNGSEVSNGNAHRGAEPRRGGGPTRSLAKTLAAGWIRTVAGTPWRARVSRLPAIAQGLYLNSGRLFSESLVAPGSTVF